MAKISWKNIALGVSQSILKTFQCFSMFQGYRSTLVQRNLNYVLYFVFFERYENTEHSFGTI